ncbi:MAG: DUF6134 family protein [Burkholderiaceae bacterium]
MTSTPLCATSSSRRLLSLAILATIASTSLADTTAAPPVAPAPSAATAWDFTVMLDGDTVGSHRFEIAPDQSGPQDLQVRSQAEFTVRFLGIPVYRYRHQAHENWRAGCLQAIVARTDDDGKVTEIDAAAHGRKLRVVVRGADDGRDSGAPSQAPDCAWSFAYWNPALSSQRLLLDPGSGRFTAVRFEALPERRIDVDGRPAPVRGIRLLGTDAPIDLWYNGDRWVGLDTSVAGGRALSYRLKPIAKETSDE